MSSTQFGFWRTTWPCDLAQGPAGPRSPGGAGPRWTRHRRPSTREDQLEREVAQRSSLIKCLHTNVVAWTLAAESGYHAIAIVGKGGDLRAGARLRVGKVDVVCARLGVLNALDSVAMQECSAGKDNRAGFSSDPADGGIGAATFPGIHQPDSTGRRVAGGYASVCTEGVKDRRGCRHDPI
jgi:hypothetical protein